MAITPCGPPKPRKAVWLCVFVLQRYEAISTFSRKYALSLWNTARSATGPDRSAEKPQLAAMRSRRPAMRPVPSKPTSYS